MSTRRKSLWNGWPELASSSPCITFNKRLYK